MKNQIVYTLFFVFFLNIGLFAKQEKYIKHKVVKGDTVNIIAQKYNVTPYDIFRLNPDSQNGIKLDSVLLIPPSSSESNGVVSGNISSKNPTTHLVQPKETLFSLSRLYNVSVESIQKENEGVLKNGLKIGQTIKIPNANSIPFSQVVKPAVAVKEESKTSESSKKPSQIANEVTNDNSGYHTIQPKETKYAVSKKYGMTVEELERLNPEISANFPVGLKIRVSSKAPSISTSEISKTAENTKTTVSTKRYLQEYVVKPKETVYSISNQFEISEDELIALNPELKKGVKLGMILRVPQITPKQVVPKKEQSDFTKTISKDKKELVLFMPFNISKIESDTVNSTQSRLKKDKFLNLTLDYYSGAMMAIDSAKVLGMNLDVRVFDSQETKNSSNLAALLQENNIDGADAIIGPFYQSNVEKLAEWTEKKKVPVISPLSKELGKSYSNLYQSMPDESRIKNALFEYMRSKNANIIAIIDSKKGSVRKYIEESQRDVKIVGLTANGSILADSLKVHLSKDKINYVVVATERTGMILSATTIMLAAQKEYKIQMAVMEHTETLDFEEISLNRLTKLKMLYPSVSKPNESVEATQFDIKYKKLNKVLPNQYAIRGFDVTFDTLMRLAQDKSFEETIQQNTTEQIESKFSYVPNEGSGYVNNGIYILHYDEDLTVKQAE